MNLMNRVESEQKEPELNKKKEIEAKSLSSTSQSSMIISKQKEVIESQKKKISDLQLEVKNYQENEKNRENQQKKISELSSTNSMLKRELQQKSEQIEKLNSADLILKENERLKEENEKLQKEKEETEKECKIQISTYKRIYDVKNVELDNVMKSVEEEKDVVKKLHDDINNEIDIRANVIANEAKIKLKERFNNKVDKIKSDYDCKKYAIYSVTLGAIIYSFIVTLLKLLSSERMRSDIVKCFTSIQAFVQNLVESNTTIIGDIWSLTDHSDNLIAWIILAVVFIILVLGIQLAIAGAIIAGIYIFLHWAYIDDKFDFAMIITMLATMIVIVWISDSLNFIGWNLVIVWVVIQFGVIVGRGILENI